VPGDEKARVWGGDVEWGIIITEYEKWGEVESEQKDE
jgi:hypothetical protein